MTSHLHALTVLPSQKLVIILYTEGGWDTSGLLDGCVSLGRSETNGVQLIAGL